ncbi:hypothetical protein F4604DRAFT_1882297 [Suillus subluteus]|nr:hypothetical protein F4604DRAFT_1882297 [Suillus subluteus]
MDLLVEAYLDYRYRDLGDGMPHIDGMPPSPSDHDGQRVFLSEIELYPNETLIYHGYLGCTPLYPTVTISLWTLAAYCQTHRVCPTFSFQAQCKTLCFLHDLPYQPYLTTQLSAAFDVYLQILWRIDQHLCTALKCDTPNWRLLNTCPTCFYKLKDEPNLDFEWLTLMDGNNSLKRWDSTIYGTNVRLDSHKVQSDFWIDLNTVDKFSGEVRAHVTNPDLGGDNTSIDNMAVETNSAPFSCADQWKNAGPEMQKKMCSVFDESGIFIAACCHRFFIGHQLKLKLLLISIRAKYPLAIIDKLLAVYGKGGTCAYDIGCAFVKTLGNNSLGTRAHQLGFHLMVGAFHGHAHNQKCQLNWHPMYIPGTEHSEGEGCEHIFSASNVLTRGTWHASTFHRHQVIDQHFMFWNDDKYAALSKIFFMCLNHNANIRLSGNFLWNHYREALKSTQTLTVELSVIKAELGIVDDNFSWYILQEHAYLDSLKQPPARDQISIRYVEALDELAERKSLQHAEMLVVHDEIQLAVEARWEIGGDEYNQFKMEARLGKYRTVLNDLERLVVMRLFEPSKLSLSGTGYKLRQQITKALQWHSEAIQNAINCYNIQAVALNPLHLKISWKDITDYSFLGNEDWAKPAHREATTKYFKLCQAHEELMQLNVKICRLRTAIHDEQVQTTAMIEDLHLLDPETR